MYCTILLPDLVTRPSTWVSLMPHNPLEVDAGAGLAGAQVLRLSQGRGICNGPGINLQITQLGNGNH